MKYRRMAWSGSSAGWVEANWQTLTEPSPTYRDYFDLDGGDRYAPQLSQASSIKLQKLGSRFGMAVIRDGSLWTCQTVGLDGTDGDYDGTESGSTVDRSAIQWLRLQTSTSGTPLSLALRNRIFDAVSTNPYYYFVPSLAVNSSSDMLVGFSGSRGVERISAFFSGRRANGTIPIRPVLIQAGRDFCNPGASGRWGDYSHTTIDPITGSFWTVQQYAENIEDTTSIWGTWISSVEAP